MGVLAFEKIELPYDWGEAYLISKNSDILKGESLIRFPHSYDSLGRVLIWKIGILGNRYKKAACDIEYLYQEVKFISNYMGIVPFLPNWVCNEVIAKLINQPIFEMIKNGTFKYFVKTYLDTFICEINNIIILYLKSEKMKAHMAFGYIY